MQNTVRLILALFLIALILNSYNSVKILGVALNSLNQDLQERTRLIAREIDQEIKEETNLGGEQLANYLRTRMKVYAVQSLILYDKTGRPQIALDIPPGLQPLVASPPAQSRKWQKYFLVPNGKSLLLIFDIGKILQFERSTKIINYLNLLLMGFAALLAFYFIESTLRPYRLLLQAAKSAPASLAVEPAHSEADFLIGTFRGVISKLKDKEQELAKLHLAEKARADDVEQLNQDLIRSISSGLILIDQMGKIRLFNHAAELILQLPCDQVLLQPYEAIIARISPAFEEDINLCFRERTNLNRAELEIRTSQNDLKYLGANIMPLRDRQQHFSGVFCLFTDITEFKLLQEHMTQKEKFATLGEMAAGVAHEFRNSLATITGYLQMLENKISTDQRKYISPMQKELQVLQKVVKDFLSFAGPVQMHISRVNLNDLLQECSEELRVLTASKSLKITMEGVFPEVAGDEVMLRQVFTNLLRNAAEAMDGAGRQGVVEITGSTSGNGKFSIIEVRDNGIGIRPADLPRIFHPFFSTKEKGVGLGLAIVQKLIVQHNGTISAESSEDGCLFRVQLPL